MKGKVSLFSVFLGLITVYASTTYGQITLPPGGVKPTTPIKDMRGQIKRCWIVVEGASIFNSPEESKKKIAEARFLEKYYVCYESKEHLLLCTLDDKEENVKEIVGWLKQEDGLTNIEAKKTQHSIYRKALVINRWWKEAKGKGDVDPAAVYDRPGGEGCKKIGEVGLFRILFTYSRAGQSGEEDYFLVGKNSVITTDETAKDTIIGWIKGNRIREWDTREALEVNKENIDRRDLVKVFESAYDLDLTLQGFKEDPKIKGRPLCSISTETGEIREVKPEYPRWPLLGTQTLTGGVRGFHIGFIGAYIPKEGEPISPEIISTKVQTYEKVLKDLGNVQMIFVIDATGSMGPWIDGAQKAIERIIELYKGKYSSIVDVEFSIAFYQDYNDITERQSVATLTRMPMTPSTRSKEISNWITENKERLVIPGAGGDGPEAVYNGILDTLREIETSGELKKNAWKGLILMGDSGNHPVDPKGLTEEDVIKAFVDKVDAFFIMHCTTQEVISRFPCVKDFEEQFRKILQEYSKKMIPPEKYTKDATLGAYIMYPDPAGLCNATIENMDKYVVYLRGYRSPEKHTSPELPTDPTGQSIHWKIQRELDKGDASIKPGMQVFDEGWVAEMDPKKGEKQTKVVLLMTRQELNLFTSVLTLVWRNLNPNNVMKTWKDAIEKSLGEEFDPKIPLKEVILKHQGIPCRYGLLEKSAEQLALVTPKEIKELGIHLQIASENLRDVEAERKSEIRVDEKSGEVKRIPLGEKNYYFLLDGTEYAWVPLEFFP